MTTALRLYYLRAKPADVYGLLVIALAGAVGVAAWGDYLPLLAFSALLPLLWAEAPSRMIAGLAAFAYYLGAARGLPTGTIIFFGPEAPSYFGVAVWLASSALLAAPWAALWTNRPTPRGFAWRLPLALALVALPPIGLVGWANPLTAAGVLFPAWGWFGLLALLALMWAMCAAEGMWRGVVAAVFVAALGLQATQGEPRAYWTAVNTDYSGNRFNPLDGPQYFMRAYEINIQLIGHATALPPRTVAVYPESLVGYWNSTTADFWQDASGALARKGSTALLGGFLNTDAKRIYDNAIIAVGADAGVKYRQRVPVPISMWRPFAQDGARAHWFDAGIFTVQGRPVAGLICYEQLLVWPALVSLAHKPQAIVAPANAWWSKTTSIPGIQRTALRAWARLFDIPLIAAFNQ